MLPCCKKRKVDYYVCKNRDGAVMRALAPHYCGPGSIPIPGVTCGLSLLLVLVLVPRVFLRVLRFSSLHKNQHAKFQFDLETVDEEPPRGSATAKSHLFIFIILLFKNKRAIIIFVLYSFQRTTKVSCYKCLHCRGKTKVSYYILLREKQKYHITFFCEKNKSIILHHVLPNSPENVSFLAAIVKIQR